MPRRKRSIEKHLETAIKRQFDQIGKFLTNTLDVNKNKKFLTTGALYEFALNFMCIKEITDNVKP